MRYGYARVSSTDQSLDVQLAQLRAAGCQDIRSEKITGTSIEARDELKHEVQGLQLTPVPGLAELKTTEAATLLPPKSNNKSCAGVVASHGTTSQNSARSAAVRLNCI